MNAFHNQLFRRIDYGLVSPMSFFFPVILYKLFINIWVIKGNVFHDQETPSGESTTTKCGVNY